MLTWRHANDMPAVSRLAIPGSPQVLLSLFHIYIYIYTHVFVISYESDMFDVLRSFMYHRHTQFFLLLREEQVTRDVEHVISFYPRIHTFGVACPQSLVVLLVGINRKILGSRFFFSPPKNQQCSLILWIFTLFIVRSSWGPVPSVTKTMRGCLWEPAVTWFTLFLGCLCDFLLTPCGESGGSPMVWNSLLGPRRLVGFSPLTPWKKQTQITRIRVCGRILTDVVSMLNLCHSLLPILQSRLRGQTLRVCVKKTVRHNPAKMDNSTDSVVDYPFLHNLQCCGLLCGGLAGMFAGSNSARFHSAKKCAKYGELSPSHVSTLCGPLALSSIEVTLNPRTLKHDWWLGYKSVPWKATNHCIQV